MAEARHRKIQEHTLRGSITRIFFSSDHFTAGRMACADGHDKPFAGKIGGLREGDRVILHGAFATDNTYGEQFRVARFEYDTQFDVQGIVNYLSTNPDIKGIGFARALKIAEFCGDEFDGIITGDPMRLTAVPGVTADIARTLHEVWTGHKDFNRCMTRLAAFDLTHKQITALTGKYGNNAARVVEENPYRLIEDIPGYGFVKADLIARKAGTSKNARSRIRSAIFHVLESALQDGDCLVAYRDLVTRSNAILKLDSLDSRDIIEAHIEQIVAEADRAICFPHDNQLFVALKSLYHMESWIAHVFRTCSGPNRKPEIRDAADHPPGDLNPDQERAVRNAMTHALCLISGGAGTGKTYTVSRIVDLYNAAGLSVALCAPTGKAAKRLEQVTGCRAYTIHRLLGYVGQAFTRGPDHHLDYDAIIVDEVSMLDVPLCYHLFRAIDFRTTNVVLVGDHNQLPPVGPGNILRDLLRQELAPATILGRVVRQAGILKENSIAILSGRVPPNVPGDAERKQWYVVDTFKDAGDILKFILHLYENVLSEKLGFDLVRDVQLLAPMKKGVLGVDNLNRELQRLIQRKCYSVDIPPVPPAKRPPLYIHDKVIQNRNHYGLDVMNGAVGAIKRIDHSSGAHHIAFDDGVRVFERGDMKHIGLAFGSSIHKSQGSECECVIAVIHKSQSFMHHRNLFYTAVTRAKQTAIIIGDRWGIRHCAETEFTDKRKTFLSLEGFTGEFE